MSKAELFGTETVDLRQVDPRASLEVLNQEQAVNDKIEDFYRRLWGANHPDRGVYVAGYVGGFSPPDWTRAKSYLATVSPEQMRKNRFLAAESVAEEIGRQLNPDLIGDPQALYAELDQRFKTQIGALLQTAKISPRLIVHTKSLTGSVDKQLIYETHSELVVETAEYFLMNELDRSLPIIGGEAVDSQLENLFDLIEIWVADRVYRRVVAELSDTPIQIDASGIFTGNSRSGRIFCSTQYQAEIAAIFGAEQSALVDNFFDEWGPLFFAKLADK